MLFPEVAAKAIETKPIYRYRQPYLKGCQDCIIAITKRADQGNPSMPELDEILLIIVAKGLPNVPYDGDLADWIDGNSDAIEYWYMNELDYPNLFDF